MSVLDIMRALVTVLWFALFVAISVGAWRRWPRGSAIASMPLESSEQVPDAPEETH